MEMGPVDGDGEGWMRRRLDQDAAGSYWGTGKYRKGAGGIWRRPDSPGRADLEDSEGGTGKSTLRPRHAKVIAVLQV